MSIFKEKVGSDRSDKSTKLFVLDYEIIRCHFVLGTIRFVIEN